MKVSLPSLAPVTVAVTVAVAAGLVLTPAQAAPAVLKVTDMTPPQAPFAVSRMQTADATLTFRVESDKGLSRRPQVLDDTSGVAFTPVSASLTSGDRNDGTWEATVALGSFMDGTHSPRVRVCTSKTACSVKDLSTDLVVDGSDWPTFGKVRQHPGRLRAGQVNGASASGSVVFSSTHDPVRGITVRLIQDAGKTGRVVDSTKADGRFTSPWPWTRPGQDSPRLSLTSSKVPGVAIARLGLGNPRTRFKVPTPRAPGVIAPGRHAVVTGTITPGYPASKLGRIELQVRTSSGWKTRDRAELKPVRSKSGPRNLARYRLSAPVGKPGKHMLRVVKPAAKCGTGACEVASNRSRPFAVQVGSRAYMVEMQLDRLGVPVGTVDGNVDARTRQALCAWRDMSGMKPSRNGVNPKVVRSVMRAKHLPAPHRTDGLYVNKTCQILLQVKGQRFQRVVWASSGMPGHETPNGTGAIFRKIHGWVESTLYPGAFMRNPMFFFPSRPAIALHGSASNSLVLPYPASHGCVRVHRPEIDRIFAESPIGTKVQVYGHY